MSLKNIPVFITVLSVAMVLLVIPFFLTFLIRIIPGGIQPPLGNTIKIYKDLAYKQGFVSPENNLSGIGVSIKNPNFANKKTLTFKLYDGQEKVLREVYLNGTNIADGKFVKILFEQIYDSKDKNFSWSVSSPESSFDDALEIFLTGKRPIWSLDLEVNGEVLPEGLSYVTLHRPVDNFGVLRKVIETFFNNIKGDYIFSIFYGFIILALILSLVSRFPFVGLKKSLKG